MQNMIEIFFENPIKIKLDPNMHTKNYRQTDKHTDVSGFFVAMSNKTKNKQCNH